MTTETHSPKVSVVMAVYNGEKYLAKAIDSILAQTFTDFEFIIIDDGSSDRTQSILQEYASQDNRIRLLPNDNNLGLTKSLNKGIHHARGKYIARQDADDLSYPNRLEEQVAVLETQADIALVTSHFKIKEGETERVYRHLPTDSQQRWTMLFYNHISGHTGIIFRKAIVDDLGGYDESFRYAQDYDLWSRILNNHDFVVIEKPLFIMQFHEDNLSKTKLIQQQEYAFAISQRQLTTLIGDIELSDVRNLYYFWAHLYNELSNYSQVNQHLKRIFSVFIEKYEVDAEDQEAIRLQICQRLWEGAGLQNGKLNYRTLWQMAQWSPRFTLRRIWKRVRSR